MKLTADQIILLANALAGIGQAFNPAAAASLRALLTVGTELNNMIQSIRTNDPEMWAKVRADFGEAAAAFEASALARNIP